MKKYISGIFAIALFAFTGIQAQTVDEIIKKHIDAHGGEATWEKIDNMKVTGMFQAFSEINDFTEIKTADGQLYTELNLGQHRVIEGISNDIYWRNDPWFERGYATITNSWDSLMLQQKVEFCTPLYKYKERGFEVTYEGIDEVDGKEMFKLRVDRGTPYPELWYLDTETYLEYYARAIWVDFGYPAGAEYFFDDFREVDGVILPFYIERMFSIRHRIMEIDRIEFNVKVDDEIFEIPLNPEAEVFQWRGEDRKGAYPATDLLTEWPENGPEQVLELENIGNGYGAPVITNDALYITGEVDSISWLFAYSLSGDLLWKADMGADWVESYPGSRSTPTIVDDLIYTTSGNGNLFCFNRENGTKVWSADMIKDLHGTFLRFGNSESPLVFKDMVYLVPGGADTNIVAFNRFNGNIKWVNKGFGERAGYNSPQLVQLPERDLIVTFSAYHLLGIDANTGEMLWEQEQTNIPVEKRGPGAGDTHSNTVYFDDGHIYYFAGDGNCANKLAITPDGEKIQTVWTNSGVDNYMGGVVKIGDYFYTCTTSGKDLRSVNAETGVDGDTLKLGSGTIITADNMLYYYSQRAKMNLVKPDKGQLELISSFKIDFGENEHFSHPVISDGVLYLRRGPVLRAWDIKE